MAFSVSAVWEARTTGSDSNGGGFDPGATFMTTTLAATSATGASPVVTSSGYNFVAGDVGAYLFIKSGTNWIPGWYPIVSVASNAATLDASVGAAILFGPQFNYAYNASAGCATTASPTVGTWAVDYSQQDSAKVVFTDLVIDATNNTRATSVLTPLGVNHIGNITNVTGGTGFTVQRVRLDQMIGTIMQFDKAVGTVASTGGTGNLGGVFATPAAATAVFILSNRLWIKQGSYTQAANATFTPVGSSSVPSSTALFTGISGYAAKRNDRPLGSTRPTITASGTTTVLVTPTSGVFIEHIILDCATVASTGINNAASNGLVARYCKISNYLTAGTSFAGATASKVYECEITGGQSGSTAAISMANAGNSVINCYVHDNVGPGIVGSTTGGTFLWNLVTNNTGASSDGILTGSGALCMFNTCHGNGRHGIFLNNATAQAMMVANNILTNNGASGTGYGLAASSATIPSDPGLGNNAFYNNASGATNNIGTPLPGITLSGLPYNNAGSGDYGLNNTAGQGAAVRALAVPLAVPGLSTTPRYADLGVVQHQDSGGSNTYIYNVME